MPVREAEELLALCEPGIIDKKYGKKSLRSSHLGSG